MGKRPLILVSNDDSYQALGVHVLIERLVEIGDVVAVCPQYPQSGKSMAITINQPLYINQLPDYKGAKMFSTTGTPVDCIKLAMYHVLDRRPDIVVAGINHGSNSAINVLYSGTMGAVMEGAAFGIPSIGFSITDHSPNADFTPCLRAVDLMTRAVLEKGLPSGVCLNVNVPNIQGVPAEMKVCDPCNGRWNDEFKEYTDPFGRKFYWITGKYENMEPDNTETDEWALAHGIISVVPVAIERTKHVDTRIDWLDQVIRQYREK